MIGQLRAEWVTCGPISWLLDDDVFSDKFFNIYNSFSIYISNNVTYYQSKITQKHRFTSKKFQKCANKMQLWKHFQYQAKGLWCFEIGTKGTLEGILSKIYYSQKFKKKWIKLKQWM